MRSAIPPFLLVSVLLVGGAGRLAYVEYSQGEALRSKALRQQSSTVRIAAQRGEILDCRGRVIAGSIRHPSAFADPRDMDDPAYVAYSLAPVLGLSAADLERELREKAHQVSGNAFIWIKRDLMHDEYKAFREVCLARRLHGVGVMFEPHRVYPFSRLASQLIGYMGVDANGIPDAAGGAGIEREFNTQLCGHDGRRTSIVDMHRRRVASGPDDYQAPVDGASVVLTIDAHIQQRAEHYLVEAVEKFKAEWGTAVVIDPRSGEVLAMASVPDFDPAQPVPPHATEADVKKLLELTRNRAVADQFEPGSIFKPFIASQALEEKLTRLDENFVINGPTRTFGARLIHDTHTYGVLSLHEVISKSSNIGMGILGGRLGNARLYEFVRRMGFGDKTGIELPGEEPGIVHDFSNWTSFSTQSVPIGQEISVTPIQIVAAFSTFCNDGVLFRPRLVRGVIDANGDTVLDNSRPIAIRRVLSPDVSRAFRLQALVETVTKGTGDKARIDGYQVFGKTGTAQIARGKSYAGNAFVASFVGGAPANDPRLACIVSIYHPTAGGSHFGGTVAAPSVGAILADALQYLQVPAELTGPAAELSGAGGD